MTGAVDTYMKRADRYFQEHLALSNQVDRHDRWIRHLADHTGTSLDDAA